MNRRTLPLLAAALALTAPPAFAYVGPGAGLGVFATLFGVLAAIVLATFGLLWYPLKRAFGGRAPAADKAAVTDEKSAPEAQGLERRESDGDEPPR